MIEIKPLRDRIVIKRKRIMKDRQTEGGLFIPDNRDDTQETMEVVAVGEGKQDEKGVRSPLAVKVGDMVVVGKWSQELNIKGLDPEFQFYMISEDEILGVLEQ